MIKSNRPTIVGMNKTTAAIRMILLFSDRNILSINLNNELSLINIINPKVVKLKNMI